MTTNKIARHDHCEAINHRLITLDGPWQPQPPSKSIAPKYSFSQGQVGEYIVRKPVTRLQSTGQVEVKDTLVSRGTKQS